LTKCSQRRSRQTTFDQAADAVPTLTINGSEKLCSAASVVSDSQDDKQSDDASSQTDSAADRDETAASV